MWNVENKPSVVDHMLSVIEWRQFKLLFSECIILVSYMIDDPWWNAIASIKKLKIYVYKLFSTNCDINCYWTMYLKDNTNSEVKQHQSEVTCNEIFILITKISTLLYMLKWARVVVLRAFKVRRKLKVHIIYIALLPLVNLQVADTVQQSTKPVKP